MPINQLTPYKLTKTQKLALENYLAGKVGVDQTAAIFGASRQRIYTIVTLIMRHAGTTKTIDVKELLKNY